MIEKLQVREGNIRAAKDGCDEDALGGVVGWGKETGRQGWLRRGHLGGAVGWGKKGRQGWLRWRTPWWRGGMGKGNWQTGMAAMENTLGGAWDGERKLTGRDGGGENALGGVVVWGKETGQPSMAATENTLGGAWDGERKRAGIDGCDENKTTHVAEFGGDTQMMIIDYYVNKIAFCRRQIWGHIVKRRRIFTTSSCFLELYYYI